ncbi:MAG: hypothetical protein IJ141_00580 [Lachnospiraceae bacterium]|nr:hypothetical protein [Lachnospiraceae bacterium]
MIEMDIKDYFRRNRKCVISGVTAAAVIAGSCFTGSVLRPVNTYSYEQEIVLAENEDEENETEVLTADKVADELTSKFQVSQKDVNKDETVYAFASADGSVNNIIVSEWLRNPEKKSELTDKTNLKDIENVKGDEAFTQNGDEITWQANGNDIYYQGTTNQELPVSVKVTYYLDGKETKAEDMAGVSGNVKIRFDYTNNTGVEKEINGKKEKVKVPFVAISGLILDENCKNVAVENGRTMPQGASTIVIGYGVPGIKDSLGLDGEDLSEELNLPDYFEVSADVTDFKLDMTMTAVVSASDFSLGDDFDTAELDSMISEMSDAGDALADGSNELADGTATLLEKMGEFKSGANQVATGASQLATGANQVATGANQVATGANDLATGAGQLVTGANDLAAGASQAATGASDLATGASQVATGASDLATGASQVATGASDLATGAGQLKDGVDTLVSNTDSLATGVNTINKSAQSISQGVATLDTALNTSMTDEQKQAVYNQASEAAVNTVNGQFAEGTDTYKTIYDKASASFKAALTNETVVSQTSAQVAAGIKADANMASLQSALYTAGTVTAYNNYKAALAEAGIASYDDFLGYLESPEGAEIKAGINAEVAGELNTLADTIATNITTQVTSGIAEKGADTIGKSVVAACQESAATAAGMAAGQAAVSGAEQTKKQIAGQIEAVGDNGYSLVSGTKALAEGTGTLAGKIPDLTTGISALSDGANKLAEGSTQLSTGTSQLATGSSQLAAGTSQLADGSSQLAAGTSQLATGSSQLAAGTNQLATGSNQLATGSSQLAAGTSQLVTGSNQLATGSSQLADGSAKIEDGVKQLSDGANKLSDGMNEFNNTAIKKIVEAYNGDIKDIAGRLQAVMEASSEYQTFTEINDGDAGITKFIIKTNGISE